MRPAKRMGRLAIALFASALPWLAPPEAAAHGGHGGGHGGGRGVHHATSSFRVPYGWGSGYPSASGASQVPAVLDPSTTPAAHVHRFVDRLLGRPPRDW